MLDGGERIGWGAKTIPEGGFVALPSRLHAPGLLIVRRRGGLVNVPALKGIHYADRVGPPGGRGCGRRAGHRADAVDARALGVYDDAVRESFIWSDLKEVRNMRQAFGRGFYMGGALAGAMTASKGQASSRGPSDRARRRSLPAVRTDRRRRYPAPDGKLTFDKLSSVYLVRATGRATTRRTTSACGRRSRTRDRESCGSSMCPAQVYEAGRRREATVEVTPSNCVQCGAITAKGGRLTPPEGGSGPEYTVTLERGSDPALAITRAGKAVAAGRGCNIALQSRRS